jgi:hypothetical protein
LEELRGGAIDQPEKFYNEAGNRLRGGPSPGFLVSFGLPPGAIDSKAKSRGLSDHGSLL